MDYLVLNNINSITLSCDCRIIRCGTNCPIDCEVVCGGRCDNFCGAKCDSYCAVRYCDGGVRAVPYSK